MRCVFDTPCRQVLLVLAQFAIAAAHRCEAALHGPNCAIAQVMRFPGTIWDAPFTDQRFGDRTASAAGRVRLERTDSDA